MRSVSIQPRHAELCQEIPIIRSKGASCSRRTHAPSARSQVELPWAPVSPRTKPLSSLSVSLSLGAPQLCPCQWTSTISHQQGIKRLNKSETRRRGWKERRRRTEDGHAASRRRKHYFLRREELPLCERDSLKCVHQGADAGGARVPLNHRFLDYRLTGRKAGKDLACEMQEEMRGCRWNESHGREGERIGWFNGPEACSWRGDSVILLFPSLPFSLSFFFSFRCRFSLFRVSAFSPDDKTNICVYIPSHRPRLLHIFMCRVVTFSNCDGGKNISCPTWIVNS